MKVTVAKCDNVPLVPVTVNVYVAAEPEQERVELPEPPVTLVGLKVQVRPAGEIVEVKATVPVKPPTGAIVIVEVAVAPARALTLVGLAVIVKSCCTAATIVTV